MRKPFSKIAGILLLLVAALHVYRIVEQLDVEVGGYPVAMVASVLAAIVAAALGVMVLREARN